MEMAARRHEQLQQAPIRTGDDFGDHTAKFSDPTAAWMHQNRDWITDPKKSARVQSAHFDAVAEGIEPDSDEYFSHVERKIGFRSGGSNRGGNVQRDISGGGNEVRLSKGEVERANDGSICWNVGNTDSRGNVIRHGDPRVGKPIGNVEYARRRIEMEKQGYYSKVD
jgi:hypothetical protein